MKSAATATPARTGSNADFEDDGVLDSSDTLEDSDDPYDDPLDTGIVPADSWSAGERFGDTLAEEREGESLDRCSPRKSRSLTRTPTRTRPPRVTCPARARILRRAPGAVRPPGRRG